MAKDEEYPLSPYFRPDWLGRYLGAMAGSDGILHRANEAVRRLVGCDQETAARALKWLAQHNWGEYRPKADEWQPITVTQPVKVLSTRRSKRAPATQVVAPTDAPVKEEHEPSSSKSPSDAQEE